MTELEMMRWIFGILLAAGSLALLVMYFCRNGKLHNGVETHLERSLLQKELLSMPLAFPTSIPSAIVASEAYEELQQNIRDGAIIGEANPLWNELEKTVLQVCPKFKSNFYLLAGGSLKQSDFQLALLVKCGVNPANMASLVGRSKSTITFRRKELGKRLFEQDLDAISVDRLICLI